MENTSSLKYNSNYNYTIVIIIFFIHNTNVQQVGFFEDLIDYYVYYVFDMNTMLIEVSSIYD